jgi:hypothetical protein
MRAQNDDVDGNASDSSKPERDEKLFMKFPPPANKMR